MENQEPKQKIDELAKLLAQMRSSDQCQWITSLLEQIEKIDSSEIQQAAIELRGYLYDRFHRASGFYLHDQVDE